MDEQHYEYRTGRTRPRQKHNGIIAVLLILVIFLGGLVSALGLLNIHLFRQLQQQDKTPLSFAEGDLVPVEPEGDSLTVAGITVQEMPDMDPEIYHLPEGLYVVDAPKNGPIIPGDVLIGFGNSAVGSLAMLNALQNTCQAGQRVELMFYRQDADYFTHTVTLEAD